VQLQYVSLINLGILQQGFAIKYLVSVNFETVLKVKLSLCLIKYHVMKMHGGVEVQRHTPVALTLCK
jgi:hypothetical protein